MLLYGIIIINIFLIFLPPIQKWDHTTEYSNILRNSNFREVLICSLALSLPQIMSHATMEWKVGWRMAMLLLLPIANIMLLVSDKSVEFVTLLVSLTFNVSMFLCCLNLFAKRTKLLSLLIFKVTIVCLSSATSISSWLLYSISYEKLYIICMVIFGVGLLLFTIILYLWLGKLLEGKFNTEYLHNSVDLLTAYLLCSSHMILLSTFSSSTKFYNFYDYFYISILLVSVTMHIAWFCHNQVDYREKDKAKVRRTSFSLLRLSLL